MTIPSPPLQQHVSEVPDRIHPFLVHPNRHETHPVSDDGCVKLDMMVPGSKVCQQDHANHWSGGMRCWWGPTTSEHVKSKWGTEAAKAKPACLVAEQTELHYSHGMLKLFQKTRYWCRCGCSFWATVFFFFFLFWNFGGSTAFHYHHQTPLNHGSLAHLQKQGRGQSMYMTVPGPKLSSNLQTS